MSAVGTPPCLCHLKCFLYVDTLPALELFQGDRNIFHHPLLF